MQSKRLHYFKSYSTENESTNVTVSYRLSCVMTAILPHYWESACKVFQKCYLANLFITQFWPAVTHAHVAIIFRKFEIVCNCTVIPLTYCFVSTCILHIACLLFSINLLIEVSEVSYLTCWELTYTYDSFWCHSGST